MEVEDRERSQLAESLHDGALQYVLAARHGSRGRHQPGAGADATAAGARVDQALAEAGRLLRSTLAQLHPAVVARGRAGRRPARRRGDHRGARSAAGALVADGWPDDLRDPGRRAPAHVRPRAAGERRPARRRDQRPGRAPAPGRAGRAHGRGRRDRHGTDVDMAARLRAGHLGLASRRIRIEAAGGRVSIRPVHPHGTRVVLEVPVIRPSGCSRAPACTGAPAGSPGELTASAAGARRAAGTGSPGCTGRSSSP